MKSLQYRTEILLYNKFSKISDLKKVREEIVQGDESVDSELLEILENRIINLKKIYRLKSVKFIKVIQGKIGLSAKPSLGKLVKLNDQNLSTIITLLTISENKKDIEYYVNKYRKDWMWFPLSASELSYDNDFRVKLHAIYDEVIVRLKSGETILIHCAAGVHRTGLFTYGLLLKLGYKRNEALELIYELRPVTALERIDKHWKWSEKMSEM